MSRWSRRSISAERWLQQGSSPLLLVMAAGMAILLTATAAVGQVRSRLRIGMALEEGAQTQALVQGAFETLAAAAADPEWPGAPDDGSSYCSPAPPFPSLCTQVLERREVESGQVQVPVRVIWQASRDSQPRAVYGWILISTADGEQRVEGVYRHRSWSE